MSEQALTTPETAEKLDFARIAPILLVVLVDLLGLTIIIPLLPLYAASFGANALQIGVITTIYPAMQFLAAPVLGGLSDRYGRKPVLVLSQIGTLIGFIVLGFANSLLLIAISRAIDGISGANISAAQAALTDSTTEKNRTQGLGLLGAAFGLGFIIGPIIAFISLAVSGNNYAVPAFVAAGFSLISILLTVFWFKETLPAEARGKNRVRHEKDITRRVLTALRQPRLGILFLIMFFQQLVFFWFREPDHFVHAEPVGYECPRQYHIVCLCRHYHRHGPGVLHWPMEPPLWRAQTGYGRLASARHRVGSHGPNTHAARSLVFTGSHVG